VDTGQNSKGKTGNVASRSNSKGNQASAVRQFTRALVCGVLAAGVVGCSHIPFLESSPDESLGESGYVKGFYGGVAADEPQAALAGRDVLTSGGNAVDAAVAVYFMLAVTMPSAAGLGGGGICLVRNSDDESIETLDFLGQPSSGQGRQVLVPGNPRGMFALHAKFGRFEWREMVRPAENLARFGSVVSRAFATDLARAEQVLAAGDPGPYRGADGRIIGERTRLVQPELAATLAQIRARGGAVIYTGNGARRFSEEAERAGFGISVRDLDASLPIWRSTIRVRFIKDSSLHFAMPRTPGGTLGAKMAAMLVAEGGFRSVSGAERAHIFAEAIQRAMADGAAGFHAVTTKREIFHVKKKRKMMTVTQTELESSYAKRLFAGFRPDRLTELAVGNRAQLPAADPGGTTSFIVIDNGGGAVACAFTMNGAFGTGREVPGTGVYLAPFPSDPTFRDLSLGLVMADRNFGNKLYLVGAASGGAASQAMLTELGLAVTYDPASKVDDVVASKARVYRDLAAGATYLEADAPAEVRDGLARRGHRVETTPQLSRVNMAFCPNGLPAEFSGCRVVTDPRGFGYSTVSE
jgi:gamma-glutamyltranspeptidase/glutathione hydrolase